MITFTNSLQKDLIFCLLTVNWNFRSSENVLLLTDLHFENLEISKVLVEPIPMDLFLPPR